MNSSHYYAFKAALKIPEFWVIVGILCLSVLMALTPQWDWDAGFSNW